MPTFYSELKKVTRNKERNAEVSLNCFVTVSRKLDFIAKTFVDSISYSICELSSLLNESFAMKQTFFEMSNATEAKDITTNQTTNQNLNELAANFANQLNMSQTGQTWNGQQWTGVTNGQANLFKHIPIIICEDVADDVDEDIDDCHYHYYMDRCEQANNQLNDRLNEQFCSHLTVPSESAAELSNVNVEKRRPPMIFAS